ncbi:MAG: VTT domain-containing protein, partial [Chloroflexota bacterium]|nr:VTT domain-containing protein [Chloroflexota bacterium]
MRTETAGGRYFVRRMSRWQWRTWAMVLVLASILAGVLFDAVFGRIIPLRPEGIRDWLDGLGPWAPLVFIILMMTAIVVSPVPSVPLDIAAGLAFGFVWGTIYVLIGAELGAIIAFSIARKLGRPRLARRLPEAAMTRIDALT